MHLSHIKMHTLLLLKTGKLASFLCSSLSKKASTDKNLIICSVLEGRCPLLFTLMVLYAAVESHRRCHPGNYSSLGWVLGLSGTETPKQRFALETPSHLSHRIGYTLKQLFYWPGKGTGGWQIRIYHQQMFTEHRLFKPSDKCHRC